MITGKFVGPGIYIEDLNSTYSWDEIERLTKTEFSELCAFMNEKELTKVLNYSGLDMFKEAHIQNILNSIKG